MEYRIAREGQTYGPYTEAEVRTYLSSGYLVETDLACTDGMTKWVPLSKLLPKQKKAKKSKSPPLDPAGLRLDLPAPPDIPWVMALVLECITLGSFFVMWDIYEGFWLRRVEPESRALLYFCVAALLFIVNSPSLYSFVVHDFSGMPRLVSTHATVIGVATFFMRILARFSMRRTLRTHFSREEPIGLTLSWFMTLVFGGLYFQYHFNRINELRRAAAQPAHL